jgi:hypothetical protein
MKYCAVIIAILFFSCGGKKALLSEQALFPEQNKNKIWLINTVPSSKKGKQSHLCALITLDNRSGKPAVNYYTTSLETGDSLFTSGGSFSENALLNDKAKFPFFIKVKQGDSVNSEQSVRITKKYIVIASEFKNAETKEESRRFKMRFKKGNSISFRRFDSPYGIYSSDPISTSERFKRRTTNVNITTISRPDSLFPAERNTSLVWLDLLFDQTEKYSLLFKISGGKAELLAYPSTQQNYPLIKVNSSFESSYSQKRYSLRFSVNIPGKGEFEVTPRVNDQEIHMKKSSFWMGGVEIREKYTKTLKGSGNMYNFSNTFAVE